MKPSQFFRKILSGYLWGNLLAMAVFAAVVCLAAKYGIDLYTHHGEKVYVPNVVNKSYADAVHILEGMGLEVEVNDTGYVKTLPPDCVLGQSLKPGSVVKTGHMVSLIINAAKTPTLAIPDVIDNSSYREARAKLTAMGFRVGEPQAVPGERDWVYGIKVRGKNVTYGQHVSVEDVLILQVGDGLIDASDSIFMADPVYEEDEDLFEEVTEEPEEELVEPEQAQPQTAQPAPPTPPAESVEPEATAEPEQ